MTADYFETPSGTPDFKTELASKLAEIAPEVVTDGKVDFEKVKELLGEDRGDERERFGLFWPGKQRALRAAQSPTTATLKPDFENSKNWDSTKNIFIEGDNLEVLKLLQKHYHSKIKMIYIDPPYNTGKDFIYPDNYKEGLDSYLEWTKQVNEEGKKLSTNSESEGRYHSNWLNMMYPRLKLARNLLADDGAIFISIDENEIAHLRKLCDEIFGETNFIAQAGWQKVYSPKNQARYLSNDYEFVLIYARNLSKFQVGLLPRTEEMDKRYTNPDNDPRGPWKSGDLVAAGERSGGHYIVRNPISGQEFDVPPGKHWAFSQTSMRELLADNRISFGKSNDSFPSVKQFLTEVKQGRVASSLFSHKEYGHTDEAKKDLIKLFGEEGKTIFETLKPVRLITGLIYLANLKNGDLVLDFFAGSGTTGQAVMEFSELNNIQLNYILVQLPEPTAKDSAASSAGYASVSEITRKRLLLSGERIEHDREQRLTLDNFADTGFRNFTLSNSHFKKWRSSNIEEIEELQQQLLDIESSAYDDATQEELLLEVLLKQGFSLTEAFRTFSVSEFEIQSVADTLILAYMNEHIKPTLELFREVVALDPSRIVVLEDAFHGDDELKTNLVQLCKSKMIELWTA